MSQERVAQVEMLIRFFNMQAGRSYKVSNEKSRNIINDCIDRNKGDMVAIKNYVRTYCGENKDATIEDCFDLCNLFAEEKKEEPVVQPKQEVAPEKPEFAMVRVDYSRAIELKVANGNEELVKALKFAIEQKELDWAGYWDEKYQWIEFSMKDVFDVIQQLQAENEELKQTKFGNWKVKFFNAQEEIERLTEERDKYADDLYWKAEVRKREDFITELTVENAELQKQVDELTERAEIAEEIANTYQSESTTKCWVDYAVKQAVKGTAKEIFKALYSMRDVYAEHYEYEIRLNEYNLQELAKQYGVEIKE